MQAQTVENVSACAKKYAFLPGLCQSSFTSCTCTHVLHKLESSVAKLLHKYTHHMDECKEYFCMNMTQADGLKISHTGMYSCNIPCIHHPFSFTFLLLGSSSSRFLSIVASTESVSLSESASLINFCMLSCSSGLLCCSQSTTLFHHSPPTHHHHHHHHHCQAPDAPQGTMSIPSL